VATWQHWRFFANVQVQIAHKVNFHNVIIHSVNSKVNRNFSRKNRDRSPYFVQRGSWFLQIVLST
jgi:hypothetical protein